MQTIEWTALKKNQLLDSFSKESVIFGIEMKSDAKSIYEESFEFHINIGKGRIIRNFERRNLSNNTFHSIL